MAVANVREFDPKVPLNAALKRVIAEWQKSGEKRVRNLQRLADGTGLGYQTIRNIVHGVSRNPELETVLRIVRHILNEEQVKAFISTYYPDLRIDNLIHCSEFEGSGAANGAALGTVQDLRSRRSGWFGGSSGPRDYDYEDLIRNVPEQSQPVPSNRAGILGSSFPSMVDVRENSLSSTKTSQLIDSYGYLSANHAFGESHHGRFLNSCSSNSKEANPDSVANFGPFIGEGQLKQNVCVLVSVGQELQSFMRKEHGIRGLQMVYDSWSHRLKSRQAKVRLRKTGDLSGSFLAAWTFHKRYSHKLSAPLGPTGNIVLALFRKAMRVVPSQLYKDVGRKAHPSVVDPLTLCLENSAVKSEVESIPAGNKTDWKTLVFIVFLLVFTAVAAKDEPERTKTGSFEARTYRMEDQHFQAYEESFPNFPTPFIYEGKKYDPVRLNSTKGIICLESETDKQDLIMHKRSAWQYMEGEITVHNLKTCFE